MGSIALDPLKKLIKNALLFVILHLLAFQRCLRTIDCQLVFLLKNENDQFCLQDLISKQDRFTETEISCYSVFNTQAYL